MKRRSFLTAALGLLAAPLSLFRKKPEEKVAMVDLTWVKPPSGDLFIRISGAGPEGGMMVKLCEKGPGGKVRVIATKPLETRLTGMHKILYARFP